MDDKKIGESELDPKEFSMHNVIHLFLQYN